MSMSKKDYEAIAQCFAHVRSMHQIDHPSDTEARGALTLTAQEIACYCAQDNKLFDRARFLKACGVQS